ncbi:aminopeptidase N [Microlunatus phosphovorus NM-1]|uniref:Aminopeptidase N n=1 Tax=Microlunatus phosphovorus (strain ATCC 700054 / DSM 10555 / JCM 9379 / NBRC 101784 / NCIMB 13414 / VKM Ac-1990 / NM-1) TaxID=1032480 RepID=F5XSV0_MICPN|nr:aminopeptidase N [Microlunatus phosphovorus]BAK37358.1 aminopeptidase N [Microlunatus phosphovorus NM-1]
MPADDDTITETAAPLSLTRTEAVERAATIRVEHTEITLDLTRPGAAFDSVSVIRFVLREGVAEGSETFVDFKGTELVAVELNGSPVDPALWQQGRIPLRDLRRANTLRIAGTMAYSSDGEGLHRHTDPADGKTYLYAMSFLDAAPRWFGCFDQPDLKSTYALDVTAPIGWTVLGNGPSGQLQPGQWQIRPSAPLSTYYVTLVAGPYASCYREHDGIRLGFHARASLAESLEAEVADLASVTVASFHYYHRLFGFRYPFGEYHQAFVPDFNAGAMENPGCVTLRDQYIFRGRATRVERASRAGTIAHEMAHQWFGDLVTMRWWDDLWLNESFAEYAAHRCCSEATNYPLWTEFGIVRKDWGSVADQSPSTHPVAGNGAPDAAAALQDFDGISYAKGAAVLKQLATYLGDEVFIAGLQDYFAQHAYGNATLADLLAAWQRAGAQDLDSWSRVWLQTAGMDTLTIDGVALLRTPPDAPASDDSAPPRPHSLAVAAVDADGTEVARQQLTVTGNQAPLGPTDPRTALLIPDAGDETWAKLRFAALWPEVAALLPRIQAPLSRVVVVNAFRDAVRGGEVDPALALDALLGLAAVDDEDVLIGSVLRFCTDVLAATYTAVAERAERVARIHQVADQLAGSSAAGSDRQLLGFRYTIATCVDAERLRRWLTGRALPAGLSLDPDLTWLIVVRLAEIVDDERVIDQALERDPSAAGRVHAARARAGLPSAAAKQTAWAALVEPSELPASELYAVARGFFRPGQTELTAAYLPRFFAEMPLTAALRSGWALGQVVSDAFPLSHATRATLELAEAALATDLAAPVRRSMVDGTDIVRRAVRSLARFASS